ncbi:MAG TPA: SCO family protein [Rhodocyclaceae bacterium]|nr:SCO family protein [Rhodocyclaceae bacterium]HRQ46296.1 SCO family protein [Rhodocyclaceae bacterium]
MSSGLSRLKFVAIAVVAVVLSACTPPEPPRFNAANMTGIEYGKDFRMHDADGRERTIAEFRGKVVMIFFGFIQCPDICPTALLRAVEIRNLLGEDARHMQLLFVTVDPERDSPEVIKAYMEAFDPSFIGLRESPERTREIADSFHVLYNKVPTGDSYTMDHTATTFIFDPTGRLRLAAPHIMPAELIADDIRTLLRTTR